MSVITREITEDELQWMQWAYNIARDSLDLSTQNGAVIISADGRLVSKGCNNIPPQSRKPERLERPAKYEWTEHAERSAIFRAALSGRSTDRATMYCCWAACTDCARAIVLSGISKLVRHSIPQHADRPDWNKSIAVADEILAESGVEVISVTGKVGYRVRFNGVMVDV